MSVMAREIASELDFVLAGRTVEREALDFAILGEAVLGAQARHSEIIEIIKTRETDLDRELNFIEEIDTIREFYRTTRVDVAHDPDFSEQQDRRLASGRSWLLIDLFQTSTTEYAREPFAQLTHGLPFVAKAVQVLATSEGLPKKAFDRLASGVLSFSDRLYDIRFISNDRLLFYPLLNLGNDIIDSYASSANHRRTFSVKKAREQWASQLIDMVGVVNLVGENGEVMKDTIESLFSWTHNSIEHGIATGNFYLPSNQTIGQYEKKVEDSLQVDRQIYGDEDFFAYAKKLREQNEAIK